MHLFDVVALTEDLPEQGLAAGAEGTVVDVHDGPEPGYEVEFTAGDGTSLASVTLRPEQLLPSRTVR